MPTIAEAGYKSLKSIAWFGLFTRAGVSQSGMQQLYAQVVEACASEEFRESMKKLLYDVATNTPQAFASLVRTDTAKWALVVKETGYTIDDRPHWATPRNWSYLRQRVRDSVAHSLAPSAMLAARAKCPTENRNQKASLRLAA